MLFLPSHWNPLSFFFFFHFLCWLIWYWSAQVWHICTLRTQTRTYLTTAYTERVSLAPPARAKWTAVPVPQKAFFSTFAWVFILPLFHSLPSQLGCIEQWLLSDTGTHSCCLLFHLWSSRVSPLKLKTILFKKMHLPYLTNKKAEIV